jgi:hypothetical protein
MMSPKISEGALEKHVDAYIEELRKQMTSELNDDAIKALAALYRQGWNDADAMFRTWERIQ